MSDIQKLRELSNCTQEEFAAKLGVSVRTIQNWEAGKVVPKSKLVLLKEIAKKFANESFYFLEASGSPGAGMGNDVGISSADLKLILDEISAQRKDYMAVIERRDEQVTQLIKLLSAKS